VKLQDFNYILPEQMIAQHPLEKRDDARLMIVNRQRGEIKHDQFKNIGNYLPQKSFLVLNQSKVIPARLFARHPLKKRSFEIFLLKDLGDGCSFKVLLRPLRRLEEGDILTVEENGLRATVIDKKNMLVRFNRKDVLDLVDKIGHMPLPPYIKRRDEAQDRQNYQTVYAQKRGSVAAPTAGLHFTRPLLNKLTQMGHSQTFVTLHINYATFKPVEVEDITQHPMHEEDYSVSRQSYTALQQAKKEGRPIVAVGTTSCRVLETIGANRQNPLAGTTKLFIYPGYKFKVVDCLITNFHQPFSTLLMLVHTFGSSSLIKKAYQQAILKDYRFFSYGDAMLIV